MSKPKVFISGTSRDLASYRDVVTRWALERDYEPVVQGEFPVQSDYGTVVQMLRDELASCDAVIHLTGLFYGFEPANRPDGEMRRSYTQLEYELGKELRRQVFRFIAREDYTPDNDITQSEEQAELQRLHRQRLMEGNEAWSATSRTTGNELYYEFSNHDELRSLLDRIEIKATLAKPQNLPLVGSLFKGRYEFIEQLRRVLTSKPTHIATVTAKQAIHGLGGVGKTRVAVEYAKRFGHEYTALLFITADSPSNLQRNLANLCGALVLDLPEKDARKQEVQVAAAIRWLREKPGWFLIIDNVDTPEAAEAVEGLLQQLDTGHAVVTSRLSQWGGAVEELSLDVISEIAATEFLLERTQGKRKPTTTDGEDAKVLASDLGRLPLALEQAGAFIATHRGSFQEYRVRWKQNEKKVIEWYDPRIMKYSASVATTWQTSFDQLSKDGQGMLNILCWVAPDPIPVALTELIATIEDAQLDPETGLADLAEYSLLNWAGNTQEFVEVHRLVQQITRYNLGEPTRASSYRQALEMVGRYLNFRHASSPDLRRSQRHSESKLHAISVVIHGEDFGNPEPCGFISIELGQYMHSRAEFEEAEFYLKRAVAIYSDIYGSDHPIYAIGLTNLAQLYQDTNRLDKAEPLMRQALLIDDANQVVQGSQYALKLSNLGRHLRDMGKATEAEPIFRRALEIEENANEPDKPNLARILNNLARLLQDIGRTSEAEPLFRRSLTIVEEEYGPDHPEVAFKLNNIGALLFELNRIEECEPFFRQALAIYDSAELSVHPDSALALNNLAQVLQATNRLAEAEPLMRRALAIDEQSYGAEHPNVARVLNNLALLLKATNRLAEAEPLMRRGLAIDEQSYGAEHPNVARDLSNLAALLQATNRLAEAEPLMARSFIIFLRSLGFEHPNTKSVRSNYLSLLNDMGLSESEANAKIQAILKEDKS